MALRQILPFFACQNLGFRQSKWPFIAILSLKWADINVLRLLLLLNHLFMLDFIKKDLCSYLFRLILGAPLI